MNDAGGGRRGEAFAIAKPVSILALLTALNFLNYLDRYLVAAVSPKFQEELGLSSFQTGLAISAFMVGYFVTSPVFGYFGDRARTPGVQVHRLATRTSLMAIGVALWSLATVLSGLAQGATSMVLARIAVGVGEASYATLAPTIIDDLAPPASKNRWLAIFYLAIPVGSALGYLLGGFLEHHFGWRPAFFVAGGPGVLLAGLVLLVREPAVAPAPIETTAGQGYRDATQTTGKLSSFAALTRAPVYVACVLGACAYTFALGGFAAWAPKFLYQAHHMELEAADFGFGVVAVCAGIVGTTLGGFLGDRGVPKDAANETRLRRYMRFSAVATMIAVPASIAVIYAPTPTTFFVAIFVCETALFASTSPINAVVLGAVPKSLRTTAMAVSIFAMHALGDFISPPLIGSIADATSSMRKGLAILPVAVAICAVLWWIGARLKIAATEAPSA